MRTFEAGARRRLQRFRQGSLLAVAVTALLLMLLGPDAAASDDTDTIVTAEATSAPPDAIVADDPGLALEEATSTLRDLLYASYGLLPKLAIAASLLVAAWLLAAVSHALLRRTLRNWHRVEALAALVRIALYLIAIAVGLSIIAGDARALLGSVGLIGLALSWALQTPIESFTGWLLNSFRGYYRVGDRIEVGEVFGDVYKIDVLTTTVWEAGGPGKAVAGAQPTGAMITFPNWEVLRSNIINYSRDFPFVWDEIAFGIANESDLAYCVEVIEATGQRVIGPSMADQAERYRALLASARLAFDIAEAPKVFLSQTDAWTVCTLRYLVHHRQRRRWASDLLLHVTRELNEPRHAGRIIPAYPRQEVLLRRQWHLQPH